MKTIFSIKFALLLSALTLSCCFAFSQTLVLTDNSSNVDASEYVRYYDGDGGNMAFSDLLSPDIKWKQIENNQIPSLGMQKKPYWFLFNIRNLSSRDEWYLSVIYPTLDSVSLYIADTSGNILVSDCRGMMVEDIKEKYRFPLFIFEIKKDQELKVLLRIKTVSYMVVPINVSAPYAFIKNERLLTDVYLAAFGILLATFFTNLMLFFISRQKAFVFLSISILAVIAFFASSLGIYDSYGLQHHTELFRTARFVFGPLMYIFHIWFVILYLNLRKHRLFYYLELAAIILFGTGLLIGLGLSSPDFSSRLIIPEMILFYLLQLVVGIYCLIKKNRHARYYVSAFLPIIIAIFVYIGVFYGLISKYALFEGIGLFTTCIFTLILTIGINEKYVDARRVQTLAEQLSLDKIRLENEINECKIVEAALSESEVRFRQLFELLPIPIVLTGYDDGRIEDMNKAYIKFTGLNRKQLIGKTAVEMGFIDLHKKEELTNLVKLFGEIETGETELTIRGEKRIVMLIFSVIEIAHKKFVIIAISDISKLKESELQLRELSITKDKFMAMMAHNMVNPFHAMISYSKELQPFTELNERASAYNLYLLQTAQNTYNLLKNLLTWSRAQTGQISFHPQKISLKDLLQESADYAKIMAYNKSIEITCSVVGDVIIEADLQMLTEIIRNLLSNAIKYSFPDSTVEVHYTETANAVNIIISDKGIGIKPDEISKLFDLAATIQKEGTEGEAGTGLGLTICKEFVKYHKGTIEVQSKPGEGSHFIVTLPKKQT